MLFSSPCGVMMMMCDCIAFGWEYYYRREVIGYINYFFTEFNVRCDVKSEENFVENDITCAHARREYI